MSDQSQDSKARPIVPAGAQPVIEFVDDWLPRPRDDKDKVCCTHDSPSLLRLGHRLFTLGTDGQALDALPGPEWLPSDHLVRHVAWGPTRDSALALYESYNQLAGEVLWRLPDAKRRIVSALFRLLSGGEFRSKRGSLTRRSFVKLACAAPRFLSPAACLSLLCYAENGAVMEVDAERTFAINSGLAAAFEPGILPYVANQAGSLIIMVATGESAAQLARQEGAREVCTGAEGHRPVGDGSKSRPSNGSDQGRVTSATIHDEPGRLTDVQQAILRVLSKAPRPLIGPVLASKAGYSAGHVRNNLPFLIKRKWVRNKRRVGYELTSDGRQHVSDICQD